MARQPNTTDAKGVWNVTRPNQQRNAEYGERWPPTQTFPPNYADGYVARFTGYSSGDTDTQTNAVNNWLRYLGANTFNAITVRCTSHDWTLQRFFHGSGMDAYGGAFYARCTVWTGEQVNNGTVMEDSGNQSYNLGWQWSPTRAIKLGVAPNYADGTAVLTQNQWYTVGVSYYQTCVARCGTWYGGNGYGSSLTSVSMTCSATDAGGTTTLTSSWEFKTAGYSYLSGQWATNDTSSSNQGPIGALQVKVWKP